MIKTTNKTYLFEKMPVKRAVLKQIIPSIASQMIVLAYNLADTYFVGMLNDPRQTAAVTVVSSPFLLLTAVSNLFGVGGASLAARSLGLHDEQQAKRISSISFWCGLCCAVIFSIIFWLLASPILRLCGATDATYDTAFGYAKWVIIFGGAGTILNLVLADLIRSEGNALIAALGVTMGAAANIILDPLFVLPDFLDMGAVGAGAATAISNMLATLFYLSYIFAKRKSTVIGINPGNLKFIRKNLGGIVAIGIPSSIQYALTVVAVSALAKFVSGYETEAVAGLGIVKKLDRVPLYFSIGVSKGMLPLLAYNFASGNQERRHRAFIFGCAVSLGFSLLCLICYEIFAPFLTRLFINDALTITYGARFLRIAVVAMPLMSVCYPMIIQFQAMGRVKESLVCSVLRKGVVDIPLLFLMDALIPLYGLMAVQPIVDTAALIAAIYFYRRLSEKQKSRVKGSWT